MRELGKREASRLAELQRYAGAPASGFGGSLSIGDLLLVLRHDPDLRALVAEIARTPDTAGAAPEPVAAPVVASAPARLTMPATNPQDGFAGPQRLLALLQRDQALCTAWLGSTQACEAGQLTRLIANAAHWDRIEALWDVLAQRCKQDQRAATTDEIAVVQESMHIHNLLWEGRQAAMVAAAAGAAFDFAAHERGNAAGQQVGQTWLPGLKNAAGQLRKKTLVHTG